MTDKQALLQEQMFFQGMLGKNALILQLLDENEKLKADQQKPADKATTAEGDK